MGGDGLAYGVAMDARISNYQPVSSQRFAASGSLPAAVTSTNSAANGPVGAVSAITNQTNNTQRTLAEVLATNPGKGKLVDIRA